MPVTQEIRPFFLGGNVRGGGLTSHKIRRHFVFQVKL